MTQQIAEKTIATVNKMNTDWPVVASVEREQFGNRRPAWRLTVTCNGIAERSDVFPTRLAAMAAFEAI